MRYHNFTFATLGHTIQTRPRGPLVFLLFVFYLNGLCPHGVYGNITLDPDLHQNRWFSTGLSWAVTSTSITGHIIQRLYVLRYIALYGLRYLFWGAMYHPDASLQ